MPVAKNLFVDKFDVIRYPLKCIFIFGCYTAKQVTRKLGIDESTYKANIQRLMSIMSNDYVYEGKLSKSKIVSIDYNRYDNIANLIISAFKLKGTTVNTISIDLCLLQLLSNEAMTVPDMHSYFSAEIPISRLYDRIEELKILGLVEKKDQLCQLTPSIFEEISPENLEELHRILYIFRHIMPISSLYHTLQETIRHNIFCQYGDEADQQDTFIFKDCFYWGMLDDEVLLASLYAKEQEKGVAFYYTYEKDGFMETEKVEGFPCKVMINKNDNRQYLFLEIGNRIKICRLDQISKIVISKVSGKAKEYDFSSCFSGFMNYEAENQFKTVKAVIDFHVEDDTLWVLNRLYREKGNGSIEMDGKYHAIYTADVIDPMGMIPWVRSFSYHAVVRKSTEHKLAEMVADSFKEMMNKYGKA